MTAITRNLPWFIKDLGVSIVGRKCYISLVENLDISDVECIKYSVSKGLGLGIVVGGSIMKVPQLLIILRAQSAQGLSLPAYVLETLSYAITTTYSARNAFPFSTYGENLFLTIQNTIITLLIIYYPSRPLTKQQLASPSSPALPLLLAVLLTVGSSALLFVLPPSALAFLQLATLPLSLASKLPQIQQNARAHSTGQLSAFAVGSQIAGCLARLFTTATEVKDSIVAAGFALALALNVVLGVQMWMYWGKGQVLGQSQLGLEKEALPRSQQQQGFHTVVQEKVEVITPPRSPAPGGRKWSRKVD